MIAWGQPARGEAIRGRVTHINDSATTFGKEGERRLRGQKGGGAGAMETGEPIFRRCAKERGRAIGSRIVDEEIEPAETMANLAKEAVDRIGEGEIGWNHQGGGSQATNFASEAGRAGGTAAVVKDHGVTELGDFFGEVRPQALGGAGDEGDVLGSAFHKRIPRVRATARTLGIS